MSTVRGNGETGGVGDGEATAEGQNSFKPYPDQQGLFGFQSTLEESSSYGNSVGTVLTELSKRPAGIVP
ncbi:hypothetical protein DPMN_120191 [Dreissena polymorpha]|uniref:Uncharacterized protein n=1 Tax=Dreissena polymorpha TaxID=45954 RepID=A0A9D4GJY6_DREPO|nr:hypothetical protein DPMN_120191 [Dreissena polymorpha]